MAPRRHIRETISPGAPTGIGLVPIEFGEQFGSAHGHRIGRIVTVQQCAAQCRGIVYRIARPDTRCGAERVIGVPAEDYG